MSRDFLIAAYKKLQQRLRYSFSHTAEDALGEAFLKLWTGSYSPADEGEAQRLLYTSMRRRLISHQRSESRHPKVHPAEVQIAEPQAEAEDVDTFYIIKELIDAQLTPLQKEILERHDMAGETYSMIAQGLGMQEAAVRMQLSRARRKIREIYKMKNEE